MAIMGSIALKMLFSMAFVLIYSLNSKEKGLILVLNFFSLYLSWGLLGVASLCSWCAVLQKYGNC
ncbi:hypothetical protein D3C84_1186320 [compost metagenome]